MIRGATTPKKAAQEVKAPEGAAAPPEWLTGSALDVWTAHAPSLLAAGLLTEWDAQAFAGWCDAVDRRARAAENLDREGEVTEYDVFDRNGRKSGTRVERNKWWGVWKDANEVVARVGARFGLTPSDRAGLKVGDGDSNRRPGADLLSG